MLQLCTYKKNYAELVAWEPCCSCTPQVRREILCHSDFDHHESTPQVRREI